MVDKTSKDVDSPLLTPRRPLSVQCFFFFQLPTKFFSVLFVLSSETCCPSFNPFIEGIFLILHKNNKKSLKEMRDVCSLLACCVVANERKLIRIEVYLKDISTNSRNLIKHYII